MTWTWSWGSWECWTVSGQRQGNTLHGWQAHNRGFYIRSSSGWSLHVLPVLAWVSSISSWFILQSKDMQDRWTGGKKFPESVNVHPSMFPWIMCWETGIGSSIPATYKKFGKIMDVFFFIPYKFYLSLHGPRKDFYGSPDECSGIKWWCFKINPFKCACRITKFDFSGNHDIIIIGNVKCWHYD